MTIYDELVARGLIAQVTDEKEIKELILNLKKAIHSTDQLMDKLIEIANES